MWFFSFCQPFSLTLVKIISHLIKYNEVVSTTLFQNNFKPFKKFLSCSQTFFYIQFAPHMNITFHKKRFLPFLFIIFYYFFRQIHCFFTLRLFLLFFLLNPRTQLSVYTTISSVSFVIFYQFLNYEAKKFVTQKNWISMIQYCSIYQKNE